MSVLQSFLPTEDERFVRCCGGYRRWERVSKHNEWWWQLSSDWGQAHIAHLVVPTTDFAIRWRVDITEPTARQASMTFCHEIHAVRLGIDGLPFRVRSQMSWQIQRGRMSLSGGCLPEAVEWPLEGRYWEAGPSTYTFRVQESLAEVYANDIRIGSTGLKLSTPSLLMVSSNASDGPESRARFGCVHVDRIATADSI